MWFNHPSRIVSVYLILWVSTQVLLVVPAYYIEKGRRRRRKKVEGAKEGRGREEEKLPL